MNLHNIFAMGGYGAYVWSAYAITLIVFGINIIGSQREKRRAEKLWRQQFDKLS